MAAGERAGQRAGRTAHRRCILLWAGDEQGPREGCGGVLEGSPTAERPSEPLLPFFDCQGCATAEVCGINNPDVCSSVAQVVESLLCLEGRP